MKSYCLYSWNKILEWVLLILIVIFIHLLKHTFVYLKTYKYVTSIFWVKYWTESCFIYETNGESYGRKNRYAATFKLCKTECFTAICCSSQIQMQFHKCTSVLLCSERFETCDTNCVKKPRCYTPQAIQASFLCAVNTSLGENDYSKNELFQNFCHLEHTFMGWYISINKMTGHGLDGWGSIPGTSR